MCVSFTYHIVCDGLELVILADAVVGDLELALVDEFLSHDGADVTREAQVMLWDRLLIFARAKECEVVSWEGEQL